ncbi:MAG: TonB family protein [Betaproteobacteria bacterium]|nr:TonB family protein [Betaproteobacteria bacterium]
MALKLSFLSILWNANRGRRLTIGFATSMTIHILILSIPIAMSEIPLMRATNSLDVILVNAHHDTAPKEAQALAQANLEGGGDSSENVRATSPLPLQEAAREGNDLVDMIRGQQSPVRQQSGQVLTQQEATVAIAKPKTVEDQPSAPQTVNGSDAADSRAMALKLEAEIAEKTRAYNQRPRIKHIGASTREYRFAQYIESWRIKAERIGELNYPKDARGNKLYDNLIMTVTIKKDGTVKEVAIRRPSKHPEVNKMAEKIVRLGEPYAPFPPEITRDTDEIEITRTWTFTNNKLGVTSR